MELLSSFLVGKPLNILAVGVVFLAVHFFLRFSGVGPDRHPKALLVPAAAWMFYAAWEWLVVTRTPEANIRVDLMLILPIVLIISIWFVVRRFR